MRKEEMQALIDKIISQEKTIIEQNKKIVFLQSLIDSITRELEKTRKEGRL